MKKTNLLKFIYEIKTLCILIVMQFGFHTQVSAQGLSCNNNINVSVDASCSAVITPDMVLEGTYNYADFTVSINGGNNIVGPNMVGQTLTVTVTGLTGNSCWGYLTIEDKLDPVISCSNAIIDCDAPLPAAPTATDACGLATVAMVSEVVVDNGCAGLYSETITRTWEATDGSGNTSTCTQVINRERTTLADILFPPNATINCDEDPDAVDPVTGLLLTGEPSGAGCGNIIITSSDNIVPVCSGTYKVFRTWTAVDWCASNANNTVSILQVINVMDSTPPVVTNPGTLTFGTSSNDCAANVSLPALTAVDDCSTIGTTEFFLNGTLIQNSILSNAAHGAHTITYNVSDECGNVATGTFDINVVDNVNPIAICDQHTTVGIGSNGFASVPAVVFDDGSYDNCGITSMSVRRMTDACNTPPDLSFQPFVEFCCADVGNIIMVEFRIEDAAGNFNSCMVEVELENNTPPSIFCPADKTIDCTVDFTNMNVTGEAVATNDCGSVTPTFTDNVNLSTCGVGTVLRTWSVSDGSNNSVSCVQTITVINSDPFYINPNNDNDPDDDIVWPPNYDTPNCTSSLEPSNLPTPYNAPVISAANCGDIAVGHDDLVLPIQAPGCIKILRTWTVIDWCQYSVGNALGDGIWEYVQILKVTNSQAPTVNCGNSDSYIQNFEPNCGATYVNLSIDANDDCTGQGNLVVNYEIKNGSGTVINTGSGNNASGAFNNGSYTITWSVMDGCGNVQVCSHPFTVVDAKKPTPVCLAAISTVVMPSSGTLTLPATTFESGSSYDNCTAYNNLIFSFSSDVTDLTRTFTCDDVANSPVTVQIWVTDDSGNQDFCTVQIDIQDTNGVCGPSGPTGPLTIDCSGASTIQNLEPNCTATFVNLLANVSTGCYLGGVTTSYNVVDASGATVSSGNGNNASQTFNNGSYTVNFTTSDACGNSQSCTHSFTVVDGVNPTAVCGTPTVSLSAGGSVTIAASAFNSGSSDNCSSLTYSFSSNVNDNNRTFTCNDFNSNPVSVELWVTDAAGNQDHCTVAVNVQDPNNACGTNGPLTVDCNGNTTFQNFDPNCGPMSVNLSVNVNTGCTQGGVGINYTIQDASGNTVHTGSGNNASHALNNGSYTIQWIVTDACGNYETCTHSFTVVDAVAPTPVCPTNNPTVTLPLDGTTLLWASDFNSGAFDNCPNSNLLFSFSTDVTNTSRVFDCVDFANSPISFDIWVTDDYGNQASCSVTANIEDPSGACGPGTLSSIEPSGLVETEEELQVEYVTMNLDGSTMNSLTTNSTGTYSFGSMNAPGSGTSYVVRPEKDMNPLNGVTTFDLVLISKHILGLQDLGSPYKEIAADANNSETITTFDIVVLRRLILQIDTEFQGTQSSWRFVDAYHTFPNGTFPFPEVMDASGMNGGVNFIGVKIGDVNGSASPNQLIGGGTDTRSFVGDLVFQLEDKKVEAGEEFTVEFRAKDFDQTLGYQFSLGFDVTKVDFVDVATNLTNLEESNFGFTLLEEGVITTSWNSHEAVTLEDDEKIFSLTFTANESLNVSEILNISSRYTPAEAYDENDIYDIALAFNGTVASDKFEVYQNTPNPFKAVTTIGFNLPKAGTTTLNVFDVSGKILKSVEVEGVKGYNSVELNRSELSARGVLYYQVETANNTATMKMILID